MAIKKKYAVDEFQEFLETTASLRNYELLNGEIIEVTSNIYSSILATNLVTFLRNFIRGKSLGYISIKNGGYIYSNDSVFAPDVAFIKKDRAIISDEGFHPVPPDFAIEFVSPSDLKNPERIRDKLAIYQDLETPLVWMAYPRRSEVEVYINGVFSHTAVTQDMLDGAGVLPGFTISVETLFNIDA